MFPSEKTELNFQYGAEEYRDLGIQIMPDARPKPEIHRCGQPSFQLLVDAVRYADRKPFGVELLIPIRLVASHHMLLIAPFRTEVVQWLPRHIDAANATDART